MRIGQSRGSYWTVQTTGSSLIRVEALHSAKPHTYSPRTARDIARLLIAAADELDPNGAEEQILPEPAELHACGGGAICIGNLSITVEAPDA